MLKNLLIERLIDKEMENLLNEVDLNRAKELGKKAVDAMPNAEQREKAKQQAIKAIKLMASKSSEIIKKVEQSAAFQKIKAEIAKEIKDPKRVKTVLSTLGKLLSKILQIISSPMRDSKKRQLLNGVLKAATPISLVGVVYNVIETILEAEIEIPFIGKVGTGINVPDLEFLDVFTQALPLILALRIVIAAYNVKSIFDFGVALGKKAKDFISKKANINEEKFDILTPEDTTALMSLINGKNK